MKDNVGTKDIVTAGISTEVIPIKHPCLYCGSPMKDANSKATRKAGLDVRICSSRCCRAKADWSTGVPRTYEESFEIEDPPPPIAVIETVVTGPEHPCPNCGKAMKDANTRETKKSGLDIRICSAKVCRAMADWSTGSAQPYAV